MLVNGTNTMALGVWNTGAGSSDLVLSPTLILDKTVQVTRGPYLQRGTDDSMLCGSYEVFEKRRRKRGRKISIAIAVLPALAEEKQPDPVFYLAGGPGGSATPSSPKRSNKSTTPRTCAKATTPPVSTATAGR